jgi:hypothetical protein
MSATILAFRDHHFTVLDAERLDSLASAMIDIGAWERVFHVASDRPGAPGFEAMLVYLPDEIYPAYSVERHRNGSYWLIDCSTMRPMVSAKTLGPVLSSFEDIGESWAL